MAKLVDIPSRFNIANKMAGGLCFVESCSENVPFLIKRVYYIYGVSADVERGFHAHKTLEQILICIKGTINITLNDGKGVVEEVALDSPSTGLYVGPSTWRTMKWMQDDSILLVLASAHYDEADYIRNYDEFLEWINKGAENADTI